MSTNITLQSNPVSPADREDCSRCSRVMGETFWCMKRRYIFDIEMAREFASDGRQKVELEPEDVEYSVDRCRINLRHVEHVDAKLPGIVAHVYFPHEDGTLVHGHRMIDGHHRAARSLQLGEPFYVHLLSETESVEVLIRAPEEVLTELRRCTRSSVSQRRRCKPGCPTQVQLRTNRTPESDHDVWLASCEIARKNREETAAAHECASGPA